MNYSKRIYHAAMYLRLSQEDGDVSNAKKAESNSISTQKAMIKQFLKDKDDIILVPIAFNWILKLWEDGVQVK